MTGSSQKLQMALRLRSTDAYYKIKMMCKFFRQFCENRNPPSLMNIGFLLSQGWHQKSRTISRSQNGPGLVPKLRFGNALARKAPALRVQVKKFIYEKSEGFITCGYAKPELCAQSRSQAGAWERVLSIC
jgi:hypothetical protein